MDDAPLSPSRLPGFSCQTEGFFHLFGAGLIYFVGPLVPRGLLPPECEGWPDECSGFDFGSRLERPRRRKNRE